jgi:hypothetical protein
MSEFKFKEGDRVRVTRPDASADSFYQKIGTVSDVWTDGSDWPLQVWFEDHSFCFWEHELEKV